MSVSSFSMSTRTDCPAWLFFCAAAPPAAGAAGFAGAFAGACGFGAGAGVGAVAGAVAADFCSLIGAAGAGAGAGAALKSIIFVSAFSISEMPITYLVGDTIEIPVAIGDEAATAVLLYDNVSVVSAEQRAKTQNGTFELEAIGEGTTTISVMFLDKDGMHIETLGFTVTVK